MECWSNGKNGVVEYWNGGILEQWSIGVME
jgi:hypothetical protein